MSHNYGFLCLCCYQQKKHYFYRSVTAPHANTQKNERLLCKQNQSHGISIASFQDLSIKDKVLFSKRITKKKSTCFSFLLKNQAALTTYIQSPGNGRRATH